MPPEGAGATTLVQARRERTGPLGVRPEAQVRRTGSPDRRRPRRAPPIRGLGQAGAESLIASVDRSLTTGLRILDLKEADVRQPELPRVEDLDGDDLAPTSEPRQGWAPGLDGTEEVGDDDREPTASQHMAETIDGAAEIDDSAERRTGDAAHQAHQVPPATADRHDPWAIGSRHDRTDAVAAEDRELAHGRRDADGQIGLPPADCTEIEAAGPIDQDGDVEVTLHDRVPDMRLPGSGEDRPVHPADVIPRLVWSRFARLDTVPQHQ